MAIAAGLMMIFFSKERINDERVQDLKLKAVNAAFSVSFTLTLIVNWFLPQPRVRRDSRLQRRDGCLALDFSI